MVVNKINDMAISQTELIRKTVEIKHISHRQIHQILQCVNNIEEKDGFIGGSIALWIYEHSADDSFSYNNPSNSWGTDMIIYRSSSDDSKRKIIRNLVSIIEYFTLTGNGKGITKLKPEKTIIPDIKIIDTQLEKPLDIIHDFDDPNWQVAITNVKTDLNGYAKFDIIFGNGFAD